MNRLTAVPRSEGEPAMAEPRDLPHADRNIAINPEDRFLDRDESDLAYIRRIAARGVDAEIPLLERLRFLEIAEAVLDEFVAVRLCRVDAAVAEPVRAGIAALRRCLLDSAETVMPGLREAGFIAAGYGQALPAAGEDLDDTFRLRLLPGLTPLTVDEEHPFPRLLHGQRAVLLELDEPDDRRRKAPLIVPLSATLPAFVRADDGTWLRSDHVLRRCAHLLVQGQGIGSVALIRVLRFNDLALSGEFSSLREEVARGLEERPRNPVVCIEIDEEAPQHLVDFVASQIPTHAESGQAFICRLPWDAIGAMAGLRPVAGRNVPRDRLSFPPQRPQPVEAVERSDGDLFAAMKGGDFLLHSPYHGFEAFTALLWQAARDPAVVAIRQTLYRTEESVVEHLLEAARRGKDVTAVVEIEARENERQNIELSRELERAGAHIVHGIVGLKVHAKLLHIVRQEDDVLREYGVFSTGNFHPGNAAAYGDLTLFTAEPVLAADLRRLLNYVTGHLPTPGTERLVAAPLALRDALIERVHREAANARAGRASGIWFKVNSLLDRRIIDALYEAAQAGVPIHGCVRRHCALRPGVAGLSPGIEIRSLIGRFLEHARVVCFANGEPLPSSASEVFIASADWMPRNFDERVEVLVPVVDERLRRTLLDYYLPAYLDDDVDSWRLEPDGSWTRLDATGRSAQASFCRLPLG